MLRVVNDGVRLVDETSDQSFCGFGNLIVLCLLRKLHQIINSVPRPVPYVPNRSIPWDRLEKGNIRLFYERKPILLRLLGVHPVVITPATTPTPDA